MGVMQATREEEMNALLGRSCQQHDKKIKDYQGYFSSALNSPPGTVIKMPKAEEVKQEMEAKKSTFGFKDGILVLLCGWVVSKLFNRWSGKSFEEFFGEYRKEIKEWLNK